MNLGEIKAFTASKLGLTDNLTKDQAGAFAKARWQMIWNYALWRQTRHSDTIAVPSGQQEITLPAEFELALLARYGASRELIGALDLSVFQGDPAGWDIPGYVAGFSPMARTADGLARIRLNRVTTEASPLLVIGKRTCIDLLVDTDRTLISGADECLTAMVMGDLYQWMRQFTKADKFFAEADSLLQKMVEIEKSQTTEISRIIPHVQQLEAGEGGNW